MKELINNLKKLDRKQYIAMTVTGLLLFFGIAILFKGYSVYNTIHTESENWSTSPIPKEQKVFNILLMGYGGPGHDGAYLTDTIMLARIDTENKKVLLISIPRDIWVEIPTEPDEDFYSKINSVYQTGLFSKNYPALPSQYSGEVGGATMLKEIIHNITGLTVDNYVAVDFTGFQEAINTLGGVDVNVEKGFTDYQYPIEGMEDDLCGVSPDDLTKFEELEAIATESPQLAYPCRYEILSFTPGIKHLDGATALKFVRSRHALEDGGDFNRARRQQLFIEAVRDKVLSIGFIPKILPLINDLEEHVRTDMPVDLMQRFLKEAPSAKDYTIDHIVLDTELYLELGVSADRQSILQSKDGLDVWDTFQQDLQNMIDGVPPTPTGVVKK